jgi:hypothetical protein
MKKHQKCMKKYILITVLSLFVLNACKKEVSSALPDNKESIALNFYAASDVLKTVGKGIVPVFIDKYEPTRIIGAFNAPYPYFDYNPQGQRLDYPSLYGSNTDIYYSRFVAGAHHYMFTDTSKIIVVDTTMTFAEKSYTCLYLTDAATADNAPAKYTIRAVEETRSVPTGKIGVRFIHLSADAGELTCNLLKADDTEMGILSSALKFGEASPYQYYDSTNISANNLLRFSLRNSATGANLTTGVAFKQGRSYVIVVSGFLHDQRRQIAAGKNPDGSTRYGSVTIGKNLRAEIRTSY